MQPVRKTIKEVHGSLIKEPPTLTMLVDGNSLLFSSFADDKVNSEGVHYGAIFQFLLQLRIQLTKRQFDKIVVTFDDEYSGVMRYNLYHDYKANRDKHYEDYGVSDYMKQYNENLKQMRNHIFNKKNKNGEIKPDKVKSDWEQFVDANFNRERDILCLMFNELFIRWHMDTVVEGDDLIAFYCKNKKPNEKILIISSDLDLCQLLSDDIMVYNQVKKLYLSNKTFKQYFGYTNENVLVKKVFCGDTSDNIGNIKGLSEEGFFNLMPEAKTRKVTIDEVKARAQQLIDERISIKKKPYVLHENIINGISNKRYDGDFYEINKLIIDLNNPLLTDEAKDEMDNMMNVPLDVTDRNVKNLLDVIYDNDLTEFNGDTRFATFFAPFKRIEEKEKQFYAVETKS